MSSMISENDIFIDENKNVVSHWDCNDANWSRGYMDPLLRYFGVEIDYSEPKWAKEVARNYLKFWRCNVEDYDVENE